MENLAYLASVTAIVALIGDWAQTARLVSASHLLEVNPILGPRPSRRRLNVYFGASTCLTVAVLCALIADRQYAMALGIAGFLAALEICCVINNWALDRAPGRLPLRRGRDDGVHADRGRQGQDREAR